MNISSYIKYLHKALLNREVHLYRSYISDYLQCKGFFKNIEVMIFTVRKKHDTARWENSTSRIKDLIREEMGKVNR